HLSASRTHQLAVSTFAPYPQTQRLGFFLDLVAIDPVPRPPQYLRPFLLAHPAERTEKSSLQKPPLIEALFTFPLRALFPFLHVVEIRPIVIRAIVPEVREELRKQHDSAPLVSLMVLWMRRSVGKEGKMGVLAFHPVAPGEKAPQEHEYKPWESKAI